MLALLRPLSTLLPSSCLLGPLFLLLKRKWGQTVACWVMTVFPWFWSVLLILARKAEQHLSLMKWELHGTSLFFPKKRCWKCMWSRKPRFLGYWKSCCSPPAAGAGHPPLLCPSRQACVLSTASEYRAAIRLDNLLKQQHVTLCNVMSSSLRFPSVFQRMCSHSVICNEKQGRGKLCLRGVVVFYLDTLTGML